MRPEIISSRCRFNDHNLKLGTCHREVQVNKVRCVRLEFLDAGAVARSLLADRGGHRKGIKPMHQATFCQKRTDSVSYGTASSEGD